MNENITKKCRFCLYEEKDDDTNKVLGIFQSELHEDLAKKIINYTQIEISPCDKIPPYICMECVDCIVKFDKFLECCWKSEKILREVYMITEANGNVKSESKSYLSNKRNLYVLDEEFCVTYNQTYVTYLEYFSESTPETNEKFESSDNDNETNYSKIEDTASDDLIEVSDSDMSSTKEKPTTQKTKVLKIDESMRILGDNTYACSICPKQFKSFFEYQDHQETHNGQLVFSCTKCDQVFSERKQLVKHDANHKVACQVCNKMVLPKSLPAHLNKHTDLHRCTECNLSHTSKAALEKHIKARHKGQKGLVCHICGKQSSCQSSLNRHLAYHSSARPYQCKQCDFSTKSRNILKVHTSRRHLGIQKPCGQCGKVLKSEVSLKQHMRRIHNPRKHVCHICQKEFTEKHSLDKHVLKHSLQRLYGCKICNTEFYTVKQLKEHMHSHRQGCVSCPNCGKQFFYKRYLEKHMAKCMPDSEVGDFKERLCRLKSTISLPSSSMQLEKLKSYE